jgi:hypothetical protein
MHISSDRLKPVGPGWVPDEPFPFRVPSCLQRTDHIYPSREPDDPIDDSHGPS